jgi:hypothetical protein
MNDIAEDADEEDAVSKARGAGCDAFLVSDESGKGPGLWHFNQKHDEGSPWSRKPIAGMKWKRIVWPFVALRGSQETDHNPQTKFSKQVAIAEMFLKTQYPEAQIPADLLKENLRESLRESREVVGLAQGELLGLGITRYARLGGSGRQISGQFKRLCIAFPSGDLRTSISTLQSRVYCRYGIDTMANSRRLENPVLDSKE